MVTSRGQFILIVGPISPEQQALQRCLRENGWRITSATDAEGALERLREGPFSLLVWDLALGSHPVAQLHPAHPQLKILAIGDFQNAGELVAAARGGANSFIIRPFSEERASYAVRSLLAGEGLSLRRPLTKEDPPIPEGMERVVNALINALDVHDRYSGSHTLRVAESAAAIARELSQPPAEVWRIWWASLLHDVGKLGVDSSVLTKPGALTSDEYDQIKQHPVLTIRIVELIGAPPELLSIIYHHHERYEGGGYPQGIGGDDIPLGARIIAVADVYDALISDRPYRGPYPPAIAQSIIQHSAGKQFDPQVVRAFFSLTKQQQSAANRPAEDVA